MKLKLTAPTIHAPNFLEFCEKAPDYIATLKQIEKRGAAMFTAVEAAQMVEMFLHFIPLPPISEIPTADELAAIEAARETARIQIKQCSAYELAEGIKAVMPALQSLLEAQLPVDA